MVAAKIYTTCPVIQVLRSVRTRYKGVPEDRKGMSAKSSTSTTEERRIELLSPKLQMKDSTICIVVLWSTAKRTALSVSRKLKIKPSAKVMIILGFPRQSRKLYSEIVKISLHSLTIAATAFLPGMQTGPKKAVPIPQ